MDIEATADIDVGESFALAYAAVKEQVDEAVRQEARAVRAKMKR